MYICIYIYMYIWSPPLRPPNMLFILIFTIKNCYFQCSHVIQTICSHTVFLCMDIFIKPYSQTVREGSFEGNGKTITTKKHIK